MSIQTNLFKHNSDKPQRGYYITQNLKTNFILEQIHSQKLHSFQKLFKCSPFEFPFQGAPL